MIKPIEKPAPDLGQIALKCFRRAVRNVRAEHRRLGLPLVVWKDGRVRKVKA
jgi:hypothetical protein